MKLFIGNKIYSSWSLRPWIALRAAGIDFEEILIPFDDAFSDTVLKVSSAGLVPVLIDGEVKVWESLAILEYVADRYPDKGLWPSASEARAHARAMSAEMHAGYSALRNACPMNLGKRFARKDRGEDVSRDVVRASALIGEARQRFGAPSGKAFLYGAFCAADAMYAPLMTRLDTYDIAVDDVTRAYVDAVLGHPAYQDWLQAALQEDLIFDLDEVDEAPIENLRPHLKF